MRVSVIGCGYLGTTHAAGMAALGYEVVAVDVLEDRVALLNEGTSPFHEPGLDDLLALGVKEQRLRFTTDVAEVADWADVHFVRLGTPQKPGELGADLPQLHTLVDELAPLLTQPTLLVGKSTVPVGTARDLLGRLRAKAPAGAGVQLAWNP